MNIIKCTENSVSINLSQVELNIILQYLLGMPSNPSDDDIKTLTGADAYSVEKLTDEIHEAYRKAFES